MDYVERIVYTAKEYMNAQKKNAFHKSQRWDAKKMHSVKIRKDTKKMYSAKSQTGYKKDVILYRIEKQRKEN